MRVPKITRKRLLIFALAMVIASAVYITAVNAPSPGVTIRFEIYEDGQRITDLLARSDVVAAVFVRAISPDGEVPVYVGPTTGMVHVPASALAPIAKNWTESLKARGSNPENFFTALIVSVAVVNKTDGRPILHATYFVDYPPAKIARGEAEVIRTLHVAKKRGESGAFVAKVDRDERRVLLPSFKFDSPHPPYTEPPRDFYCLYSTPATSYNMCWWRKAWVGVDNLTKVLPSSYFAVYNGKTYMKVPVIIAVNNYTISGSIGISIGTLTTTSQLAVGAAVAVPNDKGVSISLSGWSWGAGQQYIFADSLFLDPTRSGWIWIWGRPVFASYNYWYYARNGNNYIYYSGEEDYFYIADIYTSGSTIMHGSSFGLPNEILNFFYGGVKKQWLIVPNTALADGMLDPGEDVQFSQIFPYFDKCGADFEIGIPVGAIAATALSALTKSPQLALPMSIMSSIEATLSAQGASIYIIGNIKNYGDHPGVPNDYNVPELIYIAVGRYNYTATDIFGRTCAYSVPAGLYIESW